MECYCKACCNISFISEPLYWYNFRSFWWLQELMVEEYYFLRFSYNTMHTWFFKLSAEQFSNRSFACSAEPSDSFILNKLCSQLDWFKSIWLRFISGWHVIRAVATNAAMLILTTRPHSRVAYNKKVCAFIQEMNLHAINLIFSC